MEFWSILDLSYKHCWLKAAYILFLVWHTSTNESRNLAKSHQTMTSSVLNNNPTFWYFCVNFLTILHYKFVPTRITVCSPQGWEFDLQWWPKCGKIDIWKPENVKFPLGCLTPPSWGKPLIGAWLLMILNRYLVITWSTSQSILGQYLIDWSTLNGVCMKISWPLSDSWPRCWSSVNRGVDQVSMEYQSGVDQGC